MKKLRDVFHHAGLDSSSLEVLFKHGGGEVYRLVVPPQEALRVWRRLRELVPQTGCWPVLLGFAGDEDTPTSDRERGHRHPGVKRILTKAKSVDVAKWFEWAHARHIEAEEEALAEWQGSEGGEDVAARLEGQLRARGPYRGMERGPWPKDREGSLFEFIASDLTDGEKQRPVSVGLLPTDVSWHAPAVLNLGGWNECPPPHEHVAILRHWHERYGAEVVRLTDSEGLLEMAVSKPPRKRADALALAREQFLYCPDIVEQGCETIEALAAGLLRGEAWYFWWD